MNETGSQKGKGVMMIFSIKPWNPHREQNESELSHIISFATDGRLIGEITYDDSMLYESLPKCWTYG